MQSRRPIRKAKLETKIQPNTSPSRMPATQNVSNSVFPSKLIDVRKAGVLMTPPITPASQPKSVSLRSKMSAKLLLEADSLTPWHSRTWSAGSNACLVQGTEASPWNEFLITLNNRLVKEIQVKRSCVAKPRWRKVVPERFIYLNPSPWNKDVRYKVRVRWDRDN